MIGERDMSSSILKAGAVRANGRAFRKQALPLLAIATAVLLAGCANRDSITVGSVPDDYRTNHPIVISEKYQKIDLPVSAGDRGMSKAQRDTLLGFLDGYDRSAAPVLTIMTPVGSSNEVAAHAAAREFARTAIANGVSSRRISTENYQVGAADTSAPVRVAFTAIRAQTDKCGRWPEDIADTTDNKHYKNFGCSYQNNLAAQVANPADLIGPRKRTTIDAENRDTVIEIYREDGNGVTSGEVEY